MTGVARTQSILYRIYKQYILKCGRLARGAHCGRDLKGRIVKKINNIDRCKATRGDFLKFPYLHFILVLVFRVVILDYRH